MNAGNDFDMTAALDMLYLACCAAAGEHANAARVQRMDLPRLYRMCCTHSLAALVSAALEPLELTPPEPGLKYLREFRLAREMAVRKNLLLEAERSRLCEFMDQSGIWYMPLKGVVLKDMYPLMGLRQMSDNDILFDPAHRPQLREWFERQGYKCVAYAMSNQDAYEKPPVYNFEMHVSLHDAARARDASLYYADVKSRLVKDEGNNFGFHFTDDDFYLYFISHAFRHYDNKGTGLRFLIDMFIYLKDKVGMLDMSYINNELTKMGLAEFERDCRTLTERMFSDIQGFDMARLSDGQRLMLGYFLSCGTYGSIDNSIINGVGKKGRSRYLLTRIFPDAEYMQAFMPAVMEHSWLLPVSWIYRAAKQVPLRYRHIAKELKVVFRTRKKR